jgi:hypothetical protein
VISEKLACKLYVFCAAASVVVVVVVVVVDDDDAVGGSGGDRCAYVSVLLLSMILPGFLFSYLPSGEDADGVGQADCAG